MSRVAVCCRVLCATQDVPGRPRPCAQLDGGLFDKLDTVARLVRRARSLPITHDNGRLPFGGIQLVLCGDFFQVRTNHY